MVKDAPPASSRLPLPVDSIFHRMKLSNDARPAEDTIQSVQVQDRVLQDFRPLTRCLEWELSDLHWNSTGVLPFVENEVPFIINNTGRLSEDVAAVLFANCVESEPRSEIRILELGAGIGLYARYFLEAFHAICAKEGRDFYQRLLYLVSDRSRRSVKQWEERHLFEGHEDHVLLGTCDATRPSTFRTLQGETMELENVRAVFCNYVLDVLPSTVIRRGEHGCEELCVRTHLADEPKLIAQYTHLVLEEIKELAASNDPENRAKLVSLLSLFELEAAFRGTDGADPPHAEEALEFGADLDRVLLNYGAIDCLEACGEILEEHGLVLVNDYGPTEQAQIVDQAASQRFGLTTALGVNFPLIEHHLTRRGWTVVVPEEDQATSIHARLLSLKPLSGSLEAFRNRFDLTARRYFQEPVSEARKQLAAGRKNKALESYRTALVRNPSDWFVVGEVAEFVGLHLNDYVAGLELAQAAVALNPWYSAWLWNILGDCLFLLEQYENSHQAYLQAQRIDPRDVRTNLNLAYTHFEFAAYEDALMAIARGLAADQEGVYRARLLEKQHQILSAASARLLGEQERLARRAIRQLQSS